MADLLIDVATGDLDLSTNDAQLVTGSDEIAQHLRIRLKFFLGEWFLDTRLGVPYYQEILKKGAKLTVVQEVLRVVILSTPGIIEILSFSFDLVSVTRSLSLDLRAKITGDEVLDFNEELIV